MNALFSVRLKQLQADILTTKRKATSDFIFQLCEAADEAKDLAASEAFPEKVAEHLNYCKAVIEGLGKDLAAIVEREMPERQQKKDPLTGFPADD